jgi:hypothetical protein
LACLHGSYARISQIHGQGEKEGSALAGRIAIL